MLESLRNSAKSWVAKTLIFLLAASFAVWGIADVFTGYRAGALATVGNEEVTAEQFNQAFNNALQRLGQAGQILTPDEARQIGLDRQVLTGLIQSAAIANQAKSLKLAVSDDLIVKEAQENPAFQNSSGKFDPALFKRILEANDMTEGMYLAAERENRLRSAIADTVDGSFPASKTFVEAFFRHRNEQRDAHYFVVRTADSEAAAPTEAEIKARYEANKAAYTAPEYRVAAIIRAEPEDVTARISIGEDELRAAYEKYKGDYFTPEKRTILQMTFPSIEEARKTKDRITAGKDFMVIAVERGLKEEDVTFADKSKSDFFDPVVADAAFSLSEGSVSDPLKGSLSVSLIKVLKISPEHQQTLGEAKEALTKRLRIERAREEIDSIYGAVEDGRGAQNKFEEIAAKESLPFQLVGPIDSAGRSPEGKDIAIPRKAELLKVIFESDVGVENNPLQAGDGYIWYEVREVRPAALKPLPAVREQVIADVISTKVRELSAAKAKAFVDRANSGVTLETLSQEAGAIVQTAQGLKRGETMPEFGAAAIAALFSVPANGFSYALEDDGKGARIMQSQAVLLPPFDSGSEEAKTIASAIAEGTANDLLAFYLGALQAEAGVSINETLWRQISGTQTQ